MSAQHDIAFKQLFADPDLVRELLAAIPACRGLATAPLERVSADFVSEHGKQRYCDMVWRAGSVEAGAYLFIEFQSTIDKEMALRMSIYSGLLLQHLALEHKVHVLPQVVPVVLYSGRRVWNAPCDLRRVIRRNFRRLRAYQPEQKIMVMDQRRLGNSVVGALVRMERAELLGIKELNMNNITAEERTSHLSPDKADRIIEGYLILVDMVKSLDRYEEAMEGGRKEGLSLGRAEGKAKGLAEGRAEGRIELMREQLRRVAQHRLPTEARAVEQKIAHASESQLTEWSNRLLDGEKVEQVLGQAAREAGSDTGREKT